jgi:D-arabinan exo alpha-(1,3)/(1,5)-arabinofuranosidase (non-reducing end)
MTPALWGDPSHIDASLDCRAATPENPTGARGAGGAALGGRKGSPSVPLAPGERVVLADIEGPGTIRHIWMTFFQAPPETMRGLWMEVYYDDADEPSISVPCLDFFGLPHGRPVAFTSALAVAQQGRGFNSYVPMPFARRVRFEVTNGSEELNDLYYQLDYTLGPVAPSYLHVPFRRESPTTLKRDFTIVDGLRGPGRFLGTVVGVRTIGEGEWYGEGEVKIYRDGDDELPTICGTGLEDYIGSAWELGPHDGPYAGAPLDVREAGAETPDFVGFYRWHLPDPVMFTSDLRVTIQQIGFTAFEERDEFERFAARNEAAGRGWRLLERDAAPDLILGTHERVDDYCAAAFVYCTTPQAVPRLDVARALADIGRLPYEPPLSTEADSAALAVLRPV